MRMHASAFLIVPEPLNLRDKHRFFSELFIEMRKVFFKESAPAREDIIRTSIVAIGASTGGARAIDEITGAVPSIMPPTLAALHIGEGFSAAYAQRLNAKSKISLKEAVSGEIIYPGIVYVAPGKHDLTLEMHAGVPHIHLGAPQEGQLLCPNIDKMFASIVKAEVENAIGVLLTGMGKDGAKGLHEMHESGYRTIVQDEETSVVYGMPKAAVDLGAVDYQLPLDEIAEKCANTPKGFSRKFGASAHRGAL